MKIPKGRETSPTVARSHQPAPSDGIDAAAQPAARRSRLLAWLAAALGLAYALARFPSPFALFDNLSNFPFHFAVAFLACATTFALRGQRAFAGACLVAGLLAAAQVVPWYFGGERQQTGSPRPIVRLLVSNVFLGNRESGRVESLVTREDPDVVGLVEVNGRWLAQLGRLRERYPYRVELPSEDHAGLALYSRVPLDGARKLAFGDNGLPALAATLKMPGGDIDMLLVHASPPLDAGSVRRRNGQIQRLAVHVRESGRPTVVAGDLNLTMWNAGYRPLEDVASLANARAGQGVGPTWPAIGPIGVPIDHILATPQLRMRGFRVLPGIGSDHLPITAEIQLR